MLTGDLTGLESKIRTLTSRIQVFGRDLNRLPATIRAAPEMTALVRVSAYRLCDCENFVWGSLYLIHALGMAPQGALTPPCARCQ